MVFDEDVEKDIGIYSIDKVIGYIEINNVIFKYLIKDELVLKNLLLMINVGESIVLVGCFGFGKLIILNLLLCYYELEGESEILFDGVNIVDYKLMDFCK